MQLLRHNFLQNLEPVMVAYERENAGFDIRQPGDGVTTLVIV